MSAKGAPTGPIPGRTYLYVPVALQEHSPNSIGGSIASFRHTTAAASAYRNELEIEIQGKARQRMVGVYRDGLVGDFRDRKIHDLAVFASALQRHAHGRVNDVG